MRRHLAILIGALTLLAACGGATTDTDDVADDRGWIDGEPQWNDDADDDSGGDMATTEMAADGAAPSAGEGGARSPGNGALRAGNVDDNADFAGFLAYLDRLAELGVETRDLDPTGRIIVQVTGNDGQPIAGAEVTVTRDGDQVATVRTTADGTARFHPAFYDAPTDGEFTFTTADASTEAAAGSDATIAVDRPGGADSPVPLDVLFLLDATGSMGDEIDRLKTQIDSVAERVTALEGSPDVRFGMTLYRDEGDAFVTATRDFTADVAAFRSDLADVVADGGGDYPEAMEEGLDDALTEPSWRDPATTVQVVFLVADAPPQLDRQTQPYDASVRDAVARGIKIFPVASSESDDQAEAVFRQLAQATGARFVFLSYGAGGAATGTNTDIDATDYEELALDDLVVRIIAEELTALAGDDAPAPTTTTTPAPSTTNPPGQ